MNKLGPRLFNNIFAFHDAVGASFDNFFQVKKQRPDQTVVPLHQNMTNVVRVTENKKRLVPLSQIKTFDQLLQNIDKFEVRINNKCFLLLSDFYFRYFV